MMISHTRYIVLVTILTLGVTTMSINTELGQRHELSVIKRPRCLGIVNFIVYCAASISAYYPGIGFHGPSERCCKYARKADILYFCKKYLNTRIYSSYSVVMVASYCGKRLPKGTTCGSKSYF
ncbi:hypothetical protein PHJA_003011200 [Phtheirospermum japonicum]|uniref:Bifunctional inhibitor/plant lipid transfer protein/seed storage helical domain-containing protein n=1 Tax=Phtheirospermum japonicum TaxID=374723 RepID=A0A830CN84_9LAMI|nr:hypothetical protein PHJA_001726300 [Phtheirospermum japonicum]GFQ08672.1 hypothetical protein PHJA_003011200 [Phtheirospermum japonicum]